MEEYLLDRETLGKFVDELMKQKTLNVNSPEELNILREKSMKELDDRIGVAVFGALNNEQLRQINELMDGEDDSPETFKKFFADNNVDVAKIMTETFRDYAANFLGGANE